MLYLGEAKKRRVSYKERRGSLPPTGVNEYGMMECAWHAAMNSFVVNPYAASKEELRLTRVGCADFKRMRKRVDNNHMRMDTAQALVALLEQADYDLDVMIKLPGVVMNLVTAQRYGRLLYISGMITRKVTYKRDGNTEEIPVMRYNTIYKSYVKGWDLPKHLVEANKIPQARTKQKPIPRKAIADSEWISMIEFFRYKTFKKLSPEDRAMAASIAERESAKQGFTVKAPLTTKSAFRYSRQVLAKCWPELEKLVK